MISAELFPRVCHGYTCYHKGVPVSSFFYNVPRVFFNQSAGHHDLMPAPRALQPEIRAHAQHFPVLAPAWVRFFHCNDISHIESVCHFPGSFLLPLCVCLSLVYTSKDAQSVAVSTPCTMKRSSSLTFVQVDSVTILDCASTCTSTG